MRHALVAIEDERYYRHSGVDFEGFIRAFVTNIQAQGVDEGFSTITMQLVGNLYLDRRDISFDRKWNEMVLAWQMERKYSKNEILDMYLNTVYFGSNAYGVEAAARTYFDKDPLNLTIAEAALLAGLPQRPTDYSPRKHPEAALKRRDVVINKMYELGVITKGEAKEALAEPLELAPIRRTQRYRSRTWSPMSASSSSICSGRRRSSAAGSESRPASTPTTRTKLWRPSPPPSIKKAIRPPRW